MTFPADNPPPERPGASEDAVAKLTAPSDRKAHYRLSTATWAIILDAYKQGATVPELAAQWRVSEHALRRRITRHGATKRDWGDAEALKQAQAWAASAEARAEAEAARTAALFREVGADEAADFDPADAADLARKATVASGRAMRTGMWNEARALAALAESYARLADRMGGTNISPDKLPLETLLGVLENRDGVISRRMNFDPLGPYDAETEMKKQHIRHKVKSYRDAGYAEFVVEAIVRDMMDTGPPQPTPWPPGELGGRGG